MKKRRGTAIENMGFYVIAVILAILGIIILIYVGGKFTHKIVEEGEKFLNVFS